MILIGLSADLAASPYASRPKRRPTHFKTTAPACRVSVSLARVSWSPQYSFRDPDTREVRSSAHTKT